MGQIGLLFRKDISPFYTRPPNLPSPRQTFTRRHEIPWTGLGRLFSSVINVQNTTKQSNNSFNRCYTHMLLSGKIPPALHTTVIILFQRSQSKI